MNKFKLSDSVSMRIVQIFQEAMLTGVDGADLLRQVRLQVDESGEALVMTPEYETQVDESHKKLLQQAEELQKQQTSSKIISSN